MTCRKLVPMLALLWAGTSLAAPLTLTQALALLEQHPQWQSAAAGRDYAAGQEVLAAQRPNPELEVQLETHDRQGFMLAQPLEVAGVRDYRMQAAAQGSAQALAEQERVRRALTARIKQAFYLVLQRQSELEQAQEDLSLLEALRRAVQLRVQVGESPRYELVKAEAEWLSASSQRDVIAQQLLLSRRQLMEMLALPALPEVSGSLPEKRQCVAESGDLRSALSDHPRLQAARASSLQNGLRLRQEEALRTPQPTVRMGAEHEPGLDRLKLGVSLPLPLWHQRDGQIASARAQLRQSEAEEGVALRDLEQQFVQALTRLQTANGRLNTFENGLLREAEAAFRVAEIAYRHGERGILDYVDAQRTLRSVRRDYLNTRFERLFSCLDIEDLTGKSLVKEKP